MGHHHIGFLNRVYKALDGKQRIAGVVHEVSGKIKMILSVSTGVHTATVIETLPQIIPQRGDRRQKSTLHSAAWSKRVKRFREGFVHPLGLIGEEEGRHDDGLREILHHVEGNVLQPLVQVGCC